MRHFHPFASIFLIFTLFFSFAERQSLTAQSAAYDLVLKTGILPMAENAARFETLPVSRSSELEGRLYMLVQFYELPTASQRARVEEAGLKLLDYVGNKTWNANLPQGLSSATLQGLGIRSVMPVPAFAKWDPRLDDYLGAESGRVVLMLLTQKDLDEERVAAYLKADGIAVEAHQGRLWRVQVSAQQLASLPQLPYLVWMEPQPEKGEPEDTRGRALHRANAVNGLLPDSYHFDGSGVGVLVRDDGPLGPHIDFHGRLHNGMFTGGDGTHGDGVAGILTGAGNLDPYMKGMAPGAEVYAIPYQADFLDNTLDLHLTNGVLVTNSSYSNGCNAGYTAITNTVDGQMYEYPTFMHVFSAGNSNGSNCDYGAGGQWGNITGGHKQGKNVITTANVYQNGNLVYSSSRGPAHDGRIKPDIAANGAGHFSTDPDNQYGEFGGTSGASPGIAGVLACLHQAYRSWNEDETAPAALLKTILLNTATDKGNEGPDFQFGWGQVNALRALRAVEEGRYASAEVDQGGQYDFVLNIPAGLSQVKLMIYWPDPPAMPNASTALINDLDLLVTGPDASTHMPYVLDPTPNAANLSQPAVPGEDHLNNMEQVALLNPVAGNWTLSISGTAVPEGPQLFYISWDFIDSTPELTYPNGGEGFAPGSEQRLHWDAYGDLGDFTLEYSIDSGMVWNALATVDGGLRMYDWIVPNEISGKAMIRLTRNGQTDVSEVFSIIGVPGGLTVTAACPDSIFLSWQEVDSAVAYELFQLGDKYMEAVGTSATTEIGIPTINEDPTEDYWFAVRAITDTGMPGERSVAIHYSDGLLNCPLGTDLGLTYLSAPSVNIALGCEAFHSDVKVHLQNNGAAEITEVTLVYQVNDDTPVMETPAGFSLPAGGNMEYTFATPLDLSVNGDYELKVWGVLADDEAFFNDTLNYAFTLQIYPGDGEQPGYTEDFEAGTLPDYWAISNPDQALTWEPTNVTGADGNTTSCFFVSNFFYSDEGQEDALISLPLDLTGLSSDEHAALSFDLAYAYYNDTYFDALRVDVYTDCGDTFAGTVYYKEGSELQTDPPVTSVYEPSGPDSWRKEFINLDNFIGSSVVIRFVNITGYGNSLYIDNIGLVTGQPPVAGFSSSAPNVCAGNALLLLSTATGDDLNYSWDFGPGTTPSTAGGQGPYAVVFAQPGANIVTQTVSNGFGEDTYQQVINVLFSTQAAYSYSYQGYGQYQFANNSVSADTYLWDFGDGNTSTEASPLHKYQQAGAYTVTLSVEGPCGTDDVSETIDVITAAAEPEPIAFSLFPNPNSGVFSLRFEPDTPWRWEIKDVSGRLLRQSAGSLSANAKEVRVNTGLPAGTYFLKVETEDGYSRV